MTFRDRWVENEDGERFVFTVEMQRKLSAAGLPVEPDSLGDLDQGGGRSPASSPPRRDKEVVGPETIQIDPMTGKYVGQVKWFNNKKGYGFIVRGGGEEIFFHKSAAGDDAEDFEEGQWVLYDVEVTNKGPEAAEVELYAGEPPG